MISLLGTHCASLFQQNPGPTKRERDRKKNIRLSQWRMRMMRERRHNGSSNLDGLDLPVSLGCVSTLLCKQNTHVPMSTFSYTSVDIIGRPYFLCAASYRKRYIYLYSSISLWFCPTSRAALYWVPHRKAIGTVCNRLAIHQSAAKPTAMFAAAADHSLFSPSDPLLLNLAVACRCCSLHYRRSLILFRPPPPPRLLSVVGGRQ